MEEYLLELLAGVPIPLLFVVIAVMLFVLAKSADVLVDKAVTLSVNWGVPKVLIGATIISLGTTLPEAAVSVFAAVSGRPGLAMGNAVGSIICDTGLILGLASIIGTVPINRMVLKRQNRIQLGSGILLVVSCAVFGSIGSLFTEGGRLPQFMGFIFVGLLVLYMWRSIVWSKKTTSYVYDEDEEPIKIDKSSTPMVLLKLVLAIAGVVIASRILIPTVQETAIRLNIPQSVIAATLVAFGTSLPELVTAITAVRKGHGEIALGNVVGADILNVLFVAGTSAAFTKGGLMAPPVFFMLLFPAMLIILIVCRIGLNLSGDVMKKQFGVVLLAVYIITTVLGYLNPAAGQFL